MEDSGRSPSGRATHERSQVTQSPPTVSVPNAVWLDADRVFELLDAALNDAIEKGGNKAKSVAWDVRGYFLSEIGHYRITSAIEAQRAATLGAVHESAVAESQTPNPDLGATQP